MSMEYCFSCDIKYDTDFEEWCPKCEKSSQFRELSSLLKGIYSEIQVICDDYAKREKGI